MFRPRIRETLYFGWVFLGPQPRSWIKRHRSFATKDLFFSNIKHHRDQWIPERRRNSYRLYITIPTIKPIVVCINFKHFPDGHRTYSYDHVFVEHAHIVRKKGKRRKRRKRR